MVVLFVVLFYMRSIIPRRILLIKTLEKSKKEKKKPKEQLLEKYGDTKNTTLSKEEKEIIKTTEFLYFYKKYTFLRKYKQLEDAKTEFV